MCISLPEVEAIYNHLRRILLGICARNPKYCDEIEDAVYIQEYVELGSGCERLIAGIDVSDLVSPLEEYLEEIFCSDTLLPTDRRLDGTIHSITLSRLLYCGEARFMIKYLGGISVIRGDYGFDIRICIEDGVEYPDVDELLEVLGHGVALENIPSIDVVDPLYGVSWLHMKCGSFIESIFSLDGRFDIPERYAISTTARAVIDWAVGLEIDASDVYVMRGGVLTRGYLLNRESGEPVVLLY